jgi:[ribosomal protein S5]-alanine N-acetyltransferase
MLVIEGAKVRLQPFGEQDNTDAYLRWLNDPQVVRFSNQRFRRHDRVSSLRYLQSFPGTDNLFLSIRRKDTDQAIGTLTVYLAKPHATADVGIMIGDRAVWGQGYGQDAWSAVVQWLLQSGGIRKLTAGTLACNVSMLKLMERSGMHLEAVRKQQEIVDGKAEDVLYFARFAEPRQC